MSKNQISPVYYLNNSSENCNACNKLSTDIEMVCNDCVTEFLEQHETEDDQCITKCIHYNRLGIYCDNLHINRSRYLTSDTFLFIDRIFKERYKYPILYRRYKSILYKSILVYNYSSIQCHIYTLFNDCDLFNDELFSIIRDDVNDTIVKFLDELDYKNSNIKLDENSRILHNNRGIIRYNTANIYLRIIDNKIELRRLYNDKIKTEHQVFGNEFIRAYLANFSNDIDSAKLALLKEAEEQINTIAREIAAENNNNK